MRPDQRARLEALAEKLAEAVLLDADPDNWAGSGQVPVDMDRETRGNAVWCRKLATSTVAIFVRVEYALESRDAHGTPTAKNYDPEADIKRAEADAQRILKRIGERGKATH